MLIYSARMQSWNWNDLRYLLAVQRMGNLAGAARLLGVDDTTVSRRLKALQTALGAMLYEKNAGGVLVLSDAGQSVIRRVETMAREAERIDEAVGTIVAEASGTVRLTAVPILTNHVLAPNADTLLGRHPDLKIELIPESRNLSLTRRQADLALRLARPDSGGRQVLARRLATLDYAVYRATDSAGRDLPLIGYEDELAHLPPARWIAATAQGEAVGLSGLRVRDAVTALEAARSGIGRAVLPAIVGDRDDRLIRDPDGQPPARELWLLGHRDLMDHRRIAVVTAWLEGLFADQF